MTLHIKMIAGHNVNQKSYTRAYNGRVGSYGVDDFFGHGIYELGGQEHIMSDAAASNGNGKVFSNG